jgi:hypothetical protein
MQIIPMTPRFQLYGLGQSVSGYLDQPLPYLMFTELPPGLDDEFEAALPEIARQYAPDMIKVSRETGVSPLLLTGIAWAETLLGTGSARGKCPACTSESKTYLGLMQFADTLVPWVRQKLRNGRPKWSVPYYNFRAGAEVLILTRDEMLRRIKSRDADLGTIDKERLGQALIAGYNKGGGPATTALLSDRELDSITDKKDGIGYVSRVVGMMDAISTAMKTGTEVSLPNV